MSRGGRYAGADRMARSPPRVALRGRDRGFSPPRRDRDRRFSPRSDRYALTSRTRKHDYSPPRLHERDYLPPRAREHCYSPPRAQERQYSPPRAQERQYSPSRARERQCSPPRPREGQYSPPRAREGQYSPPRARERRYTQPPSSSAQDQKHSTAPRLPIRNYLSPMRSQNREFVPNRNVNEADGRRGEYFHELERSRRGMEKIYGGPDFGEPKGVDSSNYGGVERWYGQSQSLRPYGTDGQNGGRHDGPPNSRRKYEFRDGSGATHVGDSTSLKYQFSNLDDPRKSDVLDDPGDHGFSGARVSSELGNEGRPYLGLADGRSVPLEVDRRIRSSYEPQPSDIGVPARSSGFGDAGSYALGSHNFRMKLHRAEQNPLQGTLNLDELPTERQGLRDPYLETSTLNSLHHSKYDSSYMASSSHLNAFTNRSPTTVRNGIDSSFGENIHIPSDGRLCEPMGCGQNSGIRSPKGQVDDNGIYLQSYFAQTEERHGSRMYSDIHGTKTVPSEFYRKNVGVSEEYNHQDASGASFMDPIKYDELSHQENMIGSKRWDYIPSKQGQSTLGYFGASGALEKREQEMKILEYEANNPDYERVLYKGHRSPCMLHNNEMDEHPCTFQERSDVLYRDNNPHLDEMNDSLQQRLIEKNQILPKSSTSRLKRKHGKDRKLSICGDLGITSSSNGRNAHRQGDNADIYLEGDKDSVTISKKLKVNRSKYWKNRRTSTISTQHGRHRNLSTTMASRLSETSKYGTRDIKKRLGPHPKGVDATHSSLKHRLGPPPRKSHSTLPWLKNLTSYKVSKDLNDLDESLPDQRDDHLESSVTQQKSEPLENLEDFKQLVDNAFFKFAKHLNETPARRTKYRNQGTSSCLKCNICGRDSEEFGDVESLVIHALTSSKAGVRSQHFGFHKALCLLMGWKSAEAPNSAWVCEVLPEDETLALKEDLIIWPPVVVIHNITIANSNPDERLVVSVEELEAKLRDMGFGGKVCRGKPGNQSVLVVKFAATLSGLQEAERLGNLYAETKHGRAEFGQVSYDSTGSSVVSHEQVPSADKMEEILYGYLGIVEDLDKLDFESKRRSKLKSKKEIQSISVAP
ncbi:PREDICTED: uncharacterized protein LOC109193097 isoform X3 [Ipomoea nil]|uniref:uncharacterized protein LOC109193097 isoform X3 n=1 Tax=Ipomoea nil TaxID=35883 RepID=UPI000900D3AE|nr:PREDICTED: uncharacterized protein LOC109193097 isoform X3 [Ipomoea nil]